MLWKKLIERKVNTDSLWKGLADRLAGFLSSEICVCIFNQILIFNYWHCLIAKSYHLIEVHLRGCLVVFIMSPRPTHSAGLAREFAAADPRHPYAAVSSNSLPCGIQMPICLD